MPTVQNREMSTVRNYNHTYDDVNTAQPSGENTSGIDEAYYPYDGDGFFSGDYYGEYVYEDYLYFGFHFERPIYMYIWPVLVFLATVANILLVVILLKKKLRNPTNIVLIGIAVAEALTVLVTIPTYILAYHQFDDGPGTDVYVLTKDWCNVFMICKFFLSKWFRTTSIWLHCFLGFHRLMAIRRPFSFMPVLDMRWSVVIIVFLYACSPAPHVYRLLRKYAENGLCGWGANRRCTSGCHYQWILLLLVDLVPCFFLCLFTLLMVAKLCQSTDFLGSTEMLSKPHFTIRRTENRRSSILVTTVVLSLLIPEIPYIVFIIYMEVKYTSARLDREFHTAYEILIAMSFTTNFFINVALNTTFRNELTGLFKRCCMRLVPLTACRCRPCKVKVDYGMDGTCDVPNGTPYNETSV